MKQVVIMEAISLAMPERKNQLASLVNNLVWRVRVLCRWLIITTMSAPNPIAKGGAA